MASADPEASDSSESESVPAQGVLDAAPSARSKCRACAHPIAKGAWRVGEISPNPFAEGETTYWFHAHCAALRRAEVWSDAIAKATSSETPVAPEVLADKHLAERGVNNPRLTRLTHLEQAPSGRARCRQCREPIEKGGLRVALSIFHSGRFDPLGFAHVRCLNDYVGREVALAELEQLTESVTPELKRQLAHALDSRLEPEPE
jgi:hypothetical protein